MTTLRSIDDPSLREASQRAYDDLVPLVVWWFVIACFVTVLDLVASRAGYEPFYTRVVEHYWYVPLGTGLIGFFYMPRHKLLWGAISALGGLFALALMVAAVSLLNGLLAG